MSTGGRLRLRIGRAFRHMTPRHLVQARITRRIIQDFAEKVGLVYFGYVDQRDDDHRLIRGHTVSATHVDNHYCIGTVRGYDVMLTLRNDIRAGRAYGSVESRHHWLIFTIDLHTKRDVPHLYVGHRSRDQVYAASYERLKPLLLGGVHAYPQKFQDRYTVYGLASDAVEIEHTITPQMAEVIDTHFHDASFEVQDNTIYLYVESERPNQALLERLLSDGLWLAESIDTIYATRAG